MKNKAVGYIRVSSREQAKGYSLEDQEREIRQYCETNQIQLIRVFKDPGVSGTIPGEDRPGMSKLLQQAILNGFNLVLVRDSDRVGRETIETLRIGKALRKVGIDLIDIQGNVLNGEGKGEKILNAVKASLAEEIKDDIVRKLQTSRINKAKRGGFAGGKVPYGYKAIRESGSKYSVLRISEQEADIIKKMRSLRRTRIGKRKMSYAKIAQELNKQGYRQRNGKMWTEGTVYAVLKNPVRKGKVKIGGRYIKGEHKKII